jgi:hypothetical protein
LNNVGLNPKIDISSKFVTKVDIIEIFGLDCESLKTMNTFEPNTKRKLVKFYWQVYGTTMNFLCDFSKVTLHK